VPVSQHADPVPPGSAAGQPATGGARHTWLRFVPTREGHTVTTLELFFDLVFVFAITQVTAFMADDIGVRGLLRGLVLMALLWWAWCSYAWLGNQARADEGVVRLGMIVAMGALFLVALCIPEAWGDRAGGISAPVLLAVCLAVVRLGHLTVYSVAAGPDAALRRQLRRTGVPVCAAAVLLVVGAVIGGPAQTALWATALVVDYVGVYVTATDWRLPAPGHFAERYGLIIIIALWWAYFDVVAPVAERVLARAPVERRAGLARDSYTYLHFPMMVGIIYLALGLKKVSEYVGDTEHHSLSDPLAPIPLWAMFGGVAVYLLGHLGFRLRNIGSLNRPRAVAVVVLLLAPLALLRVPALASLAVLAALLVVLIAFEVVHYAEARAKVRAEATTHH
jgi:low temperature requirement protein LtrA